MTYSKLPNVTPPANWPAGPPLGKGVAVFGEIEK